MKRDTPNDLVNDFDASNDDPPRWTLRDVVAYAGIACAIALMVLLFVTPEGR